MALAYTVMAPRSSDTLCMVHYVKERLRIFSYTALFPPAESQFYVWNDACTLGYGACATCGILGFECDTVWGLDDFCFVSEIPLMIPSILLVSLVQTTH